MSDFPDEIILVVVGDHTPEFAFEHDVDFVRKATKERVIDYPGRDRHRLRVWSAFANHY